MNNAPRTNSIALVSNSAVLNNKARNRRPLNSIPVEPDYKPEYMTSLDDAPAIVGNSAGSVTPASPNVVRTAGTLKTSPVPVVPSMPEGDIIPQFQQSTETPRTVGGGLYSALATAAYNLAPAGLLLAGLHAVRGRKGSKRTRRNRR